MKTQKITIPILLICLLFTGVTKAQIYFQVNDTLDVTIDKDTKQKYIDAFLKDYKASEIEFNTNQESSFPLRLKNKKGNWVLYHIDYGTLYMKKKAKKYSFSFPTKHQESNYFTWAKRKGKMYWVSTENGTIETKMNFDEVMISTKKESVLFDSGNDEIIEVIDKITVRKENKWGLIEPSEYYTTFYLSHEFMYDSPKEVPEATGFESYQLKMMETIREEYNVDKLEALDEHGYYLKGRNKKSNLWGMYMGEGVVSKSIPAEYDDIIIHKNTGNYEVWRNEKVGYYNENCKLVFAPSFEDFELVHLDYIYGCALKSNGKWELYDAYEPTKLVEGSANSIDELIELWLNR